MTRQSSAPLSPSRRAQIESQAAEWIGRRDAGLDAAGQRELELWLEADPVHRREFEQCDSAWTALDRPRARGTTGLVEAGLARRSRRRRLRRATVASLLVVGLAWLGVQQWRGFGLGHPQAALVVRAPIERTLPDGSHAELNQGAEIETDFEQGRRRIRLVRGEAHFEVQHDVNHPFIVEVGGVAVRAVGTAFAVRYSGEHVEVLVTEGRVVLDRAAPAVVTGEGEGGGVTGPAAARQLELSVGQRTTLPAQPAIMAAEVLEMTDADYTERLGWRGNSLEFSGTPLVEVVKQFNLRNRRKLVIGDPALESVEVSGIFRGDNLKGFVRLLEGSFGVEVKPSKTEIIMYRAP